MQYIYNFWNQKKDLLLITAFLIGMAFSSWRVIVWFVDPFEPSESSLTELQLIEDLKNK